MDENGGELVYYSYVNKQDFLSREEEVNLAHLVAQGDDLARRKFIETNLRIVVKIAKRFSIKHKVPVEDLIQEGTFGLMKAVEKFDPSKGVRFETYATWWIRQPILSFLNFGIIWLPVHVKKDVHRLFKITRENNIENTHDNDSIVKIVGEFNRVYPKKEGEYTVGDIQKMLKNSLLYFQSSLSQPLFDNSDETLADSIMDINAVDPINDISRAHTRKEVRKFLCILNERYQLVLKKRFDLDNKGECTHKEIGVTIGVTRERVRQLIAESFAKLKNKMTHLQGEI